MKKIFYVLLLTAISLQAQTTGVNKLKIASNPEKTTATRVVVQDATTGEVGYVAKSSIQTDISGKENTIATGTTSQYWRGDKSWQTLPTYTLSGLGGQPLDANLTSIGALSGTSGFLKKTAANTWALDTNSYLTGISSANVTTALGYTPYNSSNPSGYITSSGRAFPRRADGANINFNLSSSIVASATSTTTILGTENGTDVSNYSASSLSVGYAFNAGSLSNMNISQFTNNSGYITGSYLPLSGGTVSGSVTATAFYASSDLRLKDIISRDGDMITYTWKDKRDTKTHYGYIAQEIKKEMPDQVNIDDKGYLAVNYIEVLVAKINALEKEVKLLKSKQK